MRKVQLAQVHRLMQTAHPTSHTVALAHALHFANQAAKALAVPCRPKPAQQTHVLQSSADSPISTDNAIQ